MKSIISQAREQAKQDPVDVKKLIACMDLTNLDTAATLADIHQLCESARQHQVAAVCVYSTWLHDVKNFTHASGVAIATVINFPAGKKDIKNINEEVNDAIAMGATEIDAVIPYQAYLQTKDKACVKFLVSSCKKLLTTQKLKIILESGAFEDMHLLREAALTALEAGADFLKTSTGKISQGADMERSAVILQAIKDFGDVHRGFKVSGGVRTAEQAQEYFALTQLMLDKKELGKNDFRLGASGLLNELCR